MPYPESFREVTSARMNRFGRATMLNIVEKTRFINKKLKIIILQPQISFPQFTKINELLVIM
jgi:hypothetical protein